jgi:glycosyltransferase involved in cell wall biosynthesis
MRVLAFPRDPDPYQGLLYREMQAFGVDVRYIGGLTPSATLNLLLLPFEVVYRRLAGARLIHVHWLYTFVPGFGQARPVVRRVAFLWFRMWLRECRLLGMHLIWTAHNVLPHEPIFVDDAAARRALVGACDVVLAHSPSALAELAAIGAVAHRSAIVEHGPFTPTDPPDRLRLPASGDGPRHFLFLGRVREYKGVDDLLSAFAALPEDLAVRLSVAGQCDDPALRSRLCTLARDTGRDITMRLQRVPDEELTQLLAAADVVVLPYRRITTSGSALLALSHGRPLIVPNQAADVAGLPDDALLRYDGSQLGLVEALTRAGQADGEVLASMSAAAFKSAAMTTWQDIAARTYAEMRAMLGEARSENRGSVRPVSDRGQTG